VARTREAGVIDVVADMFVCCFVCLESRRVEMCWGWDRPAKKVGVESKATEEYYAGTSRLCADAN
jgi:hypothetical protein